MPMTGRIGALLLLAATAAVGPFGPIRAEEAPAHDPVAELARRLDRGEARLEYRPGSGYLRSLLEQLDINVDSQVLVFSKTSFQQAFISPQAPRAVFFNDTTAVGSVQNGDVFELIGLDPDQGLNFYTLGTRPTAAPEFRRRGVECAFCHAPSNKGVPGLVVASVIPDAQGTPFFSGTFFATTDHRTPFDQRWGGWYVTGTHGSQVHQGNAVAPDPDHPAELDQAGTQNVTSLAGRFDASNYLAATSDIVALMTLEHQVGMINGLLRVRRQFERAQLSAMNEATVKALDDAVDELVAYMLFADEAPLVEPVAGVSTFSQTFPRRGPRDRRGRSLRDFDLQTRLFRYPLTYLIYSDAFDRLPDGLRRRIYQRLYDVLTGKETSDRFKARTLAERRDVLEILRDTKPNLPAYWKADGAAPVSGG